MSQTYTVYLAPRGREADLEKELGHNVIERYDRLFMCNQPVHPVYFCQNIWYDARKIPVSSIKDTAKKLRAIQRNWAFYPHDLHRRATLVSENLPHMSLKPLPYGTLPPDSPLGAWCLLDKDTLLAAPETALPVANGLYDFEENKTTPPNRAYLKLWETFTRLKTFPKKGSKAVDLGASPGGWTWVLQDSGCDVLAVDKAPLDKKIPRLPRVSFRQDSAFALAPKDIGPVDWLCSDIICYPDRLYGLVQTWMESGLAENMIMTIKLQGETDFAAVQTFADIPNSRIMHLYNNKHELTWVWSKGGLEGA